MYDALTSRYGFSCPVRGETSVTLSAFRSLEALAGTSHPVVYRVTFACACGGEHAGLVTHEELDWAPLAGSDAVFLNVMTARLEAAALELLDLAARQIQAGRWPWSFFCYPEAVPRPVTPSSFRLLAPCADTVGVAVRCPACGSTSINLVTRPHVDVPFHCDATVGVVAHVFETDALRTLAEFDAELRAGSFDEKRLLLDG